MHSRLHSLLLTYCARFLRYVSWQRLRLATPLSWRRVRLATRMFGDGAFLATRTFDDACRDFESLSFISLPLGLALQVGIR